MEHKGKTRLVLPRAKGGGACGRGYKHSRERE
jgi:hypothetical protein